MCKVWLGKWRGGAGAGCKNMLLYLRGRQIDTFTTPIVLMGLDVNVEMFRLLDGSV